MYHVLMCVCWLVDLDTYGQRCRSGRSARITSLKICSRSSAGRSRKPVAILGEEVEILYKDSAGRSAVRNAERRYFELKRARILFPGGMRGNDRNLEEEER